MATLGKRLREQRLAKGVELSRIAADTRIGVRYLEALENEDTKTLPGAIFARSFARQYARYVGIDESEIEAEVQDLFKNEDGLTPVDSPGETKPIQVAPLSDVFGGTGSRGMRFPWPAMTLAAVVAVCSVVYVGWQRFQTEDPRLASVDESFQPDEQTQVEPASQMAEPAQTQSVDFASAGGDSGMAVQITASQPTWIRFTTNGQVIFSGILEANETRTFAGVEGGQIRVGNAGGLEVRANGKSIGPIGAPGQVKVVVLTPDGPPVIKNTQGFTAEQNGSTGT